MNASKLHNIGLKSERRIYLLDARKKSTPIIDQSAHYFKVNTLVWFIAFLKQFMCSSMRAVSKLFFASVKNEYVFD